MTAAVGTEPPRTELLLALATDVVAAWYFGWMTLQLSGNTQAFAGLYKGLGAELPVPTRFLVENGQWFYPTFFGGLVLLLGAKEALISDKRLSSIVTCLVAVAGQFAYHWLTTAYYLPMLDLFRKLG